MDELRIWDVARSEPDNAGGMSRQMTSAPRLVARYDFEEGMGTVATDSIGTTDGAIFGATFTTPGREPCAP